MAFYAICQKGKIKESFVLLTFLLAPRHKCGQKQRYLKEKLNKHSQLGSLVTSVVMPEHISVI